jgi:Protein of unknown function (DUF3987)
MPTLKQLQALGYTDSDTVFYRAIHPTKGARKIEGKGFDIPAALQKASDEGYNLYLVVNGRGQLDADVTHGRAVFYEHDDLDKTAQIDLWQSLGLPEPTFQVDTGGKSIHSYWVFDTPCPIGDWKALQADLLEFADADRTIKNPSRVMRLAGFKHQKTGELARIVTNSGQRYIFDQIRDIIPAQTPKENRPMPTVEAVAGDMPLRVCLSKDSRELLENGAGEGGRNVDGAKLARDLIGTSTQLQSMGQRFDGDARQLFDQYCGRCSPPIGNSEAGQIWISADKSGPGASLSSDKIEACIEAWQKRQQRPASGAKGNPKPQSNVVPINRSDAPQVSYEAAIKDLAAKGYLPYDTLVFEQTRIAEQYGKSAIDVKTAYAAVNSVLAEIETRQDVKQGIDQYLKLAQAKLDLRSMLPDDFVGCLEELGELLGTSPEVMLTTMLSAVASLCKIGTRLKLGQSGYYAKPIFWGATIIPSGGNKSGTQRTVLSPLEAMQSDELKRYDAESKQYQRDLKAWEKADKKTRGEMYDEPKPARRYILKRATKQAVIKIQCQQPEHGLLVFRDELSGWFNSMSEHAKGNSDDFDFWCEAKNGDGFIDDTKSSGNAYSVASSVSVCGGTQPQTIQRLMGDFSDGQGMWARFGPCFVERKRRARPSMNGREISIFDWLKNTYERIAALPDVTYLMESDAYEIWADYSDELKDMTEAESRDALCSVMSKAESESGTLVMLLHLLNAALRGEAPTPNISADMAFSGVTFSKFLLGQVHQLHRLGDEKRGEVDAVLAALLEKAKHLGGRINWKQARALRALYVEKYGGKKGQATRPQVERHFAQLEALGYGSTDGEGDHFGFTLASSREQTVSKDQMSYDFNFTEADLAS